SLCDDAQGDYSGVRRSDGQPITSGMSNTTTKRSRMEPAARRKSLVPSASIAGLCAGYRERDGKSSHCFPKPPPVGLFVLPPVPYHDLNRLAHIPPARRRT